MADEVATLIFKAKTGDLVKAEAVLSRVEKQSGKTARASDKLASGVKKLAIAYLGVATAVAGMRKLVSSSRSFDVLNAKLTTATGSVENAARAFAAIEKFGASTPFQIDEITESFIKLRNFGLDPSEKALMAYGNIAAALGKTLDQVVQGTANATMGEMEMLKALSISSKTMGDQITFTFQGISTTMEKTSDNIQNYIQGIGNVNFADAATKQADTLDGAMSNLEDSWESLWMKMGSDGASDEMSSGIRELSAVLSDPDLLKGAQTFATGVVGGITAIGKAAILYVKYVSWLNQELTALFSTAAVGDMSNLESQLADNYEQIDALNSLISDTRPSDLQIQSYRAQTKALEENNREIQRRIQRTKELNEIKMPVKEDPDDEGKGILGEFEIIGGDKTAKTLTQGREAALQKLFDIGKTERQLETDKYKDLLATQAQFEKDLNMSAEQGIQVREALKTEHEERMRLIGVDETDKADAAAKEIEDLKMLYMTEEALEIADYQAKIDRLREFLELKKITQSEFDEMEAVATEDHEARKTEIKDETWNKENEWMQDGLSMADKYYAGMEGKDAAHARVAIQAMKLLGDAKKRSALKNAIVKGWEGISEAAATAPPPANFIPIAIATAQMGASVGGIMGARELGGQVMQEEPYLVGERGPELFVPGSQGNIVNNDKLNRAGGSQEGQQQVAVNVNIQAMDGASVEQVLDDNRGYIFSMINDAVNDQGRGALV